MHTLKVVAAICGALVLASAGSAAFADAPRAKGTKSPRTATPVAHPKGKICPKTGQLILIRK